MSREHRDVKEDPFLNVVRGDKVEETRVCHEFRKKGECRFGKRCRNSHDHSNVLGIDWGKDGLLSACTVRKQKFSHYQSMYHANRSLY